MNQTITKFLLAAACVAATPSLTTAQFVIGSSATSAPAKKQDPQPSREQMQVRLAEVLSILEEEDLSPEQRAKAKAKVQELIERLAKENADPVRGSSGAGRSGARMSRALTTDSTSPEPDVVVRARAIEFEPGQGHARIRVQGHEGGQVEVREVAAPEACEAECEVACEEVCEEGKTVEVRRAVGRAPKPPRPAKAPRAPMAPSATDLTPVEFPMVVDLRDVVDANEKFAVERALLHTRDAARYAEGTKKFEGAKQALEIARLRFAERAADAAKSRGRMDAARAAHEDAVDVLLLSEEAGPAHVDEQAEMRAMLDEMRAEMREIRSLIKQLRRKSDEMEDVRGEAAGGDAPATGQAFDEYRAFATTLPAMPAMPEMPAMPKLPTPPNSIHYVDTRALAPAGTAPKSGR